MNAASMGCCSNMVEQIELIIYAIIQVLRDFFHQKSKIWKKILVNTITWIYRFSGSANLLALTILHVRHNLNWVNIVILERIEIQHSYVSCKSLKVMNLTDWEFNLNV